MMYIEHVRKNAISKYTYGVQMMNLAAVAVTFVIMIVTMILSSIAGYYYGVENAYGFFENGLELLAIIAANIVVYFVAEIINSKMES